jgi:hypothetical protein
MRRQTYSKIKTKHGVNIHLTTSRQTKVQKYMYDLGGLTRRAAEIQSIFRFKGIFHVFVKKI